MSRDLIADLARRQYEFDRERMDRMGHTLPTWGGASLETRDLYVQRAALAAEALSASEARNRSLEEAMQAGIDLQERFYGNATALHLIDASPALVVKAIRGPGDAAGLEDWTAAVGDARAVLAAAPQAVCPDKPNSAGDATVRIVEAGWQDPTEDQPERRFVLSCVFMGPTPKWPLSTIWGDELLTLSRTGIPAQLGAELQAQHRDDLIQTPTPETDNAR